MALPVDTAEPAFQKAIREFKTVLSDNELYRKILETKTVDHVYDAMEELQNEQAKKNAMGHLSKIFPYLERLHEYAGVLDTFAQVKPDVLCLLWGPVKLLLQWASVLKQSFDEIINTIEEIGEPLSELQVYVELFPHKECIPRILALIFQDLLDFYSIALKFFRKSPCRIVYEAAWPNRRAKISIAVSSLQRHCSHLKNRVYLENLQLEADARVKAFDHFEKSEKSAQRAEYRAIKESFSPDDYCKDLEKLRGMVCEGTGQWLEKDANFVKWCNISQKSDRMLWLQGIPGAGKTFLCCNVVHNTSSVNPTIFAFLSHKFSATTTVRSIIHSFLFQLCDSIEHLQVILCETEIRKLKLDLAAVVTLLKMLLCIAGPIFIVIDGLDEIEVLERTRVSRYLLEILKESEDTRIFVSSRTEADIERILGDQSIPIRVDGKNLGSIQAFISHRLHEWFEDRNFFTEARSEIAKLLEPLAFTSKGMFLYAKVVLSSVEDLDDIDSIRKSLTVLPKDLDEAYSRIWQRIDILKPTRADKARKLLGWVGCSPSPMTKQEVEAALAIRGDDFDGCRGVIAETTAIKDCGPLLEVVEDNVQFVHFTVKEYIFSSHIPNNPISFLESSFSLANCCIQYLCQRHHDVDLSTDELDSLLVLGVFRFHDYASTMWLQLVEQCCRLSQTLPRDDQINLLQLLDEKRCNSLFDQKEELNVTAATKLQPFQEVNPEIHKLLHRAISFRNTCSEKGFDKRKATPWIGLDPLTITHTSIRVLSAVDQLLCGTVAHQQNCQCIKVQCHFGQRPFKCSFLGCFFGRQGFRTKALRSAHQKHHDKPWKCTESDCQFSQGFLSRKMRDQHWEHCHREGAKGIEILSVLEEDDVLPLLTEFVKTNDVASVELLAPQLPSWQKPDFSNVVGRFGSIQLLNLRLDYYSLETVAISAINGANIDVFQYLMFDLRAKVNFSDLLPNILRSDVQAFRDGWEQLLDVQRRKLVAARGGGQIRPFTKNSILEAVNDRLENAIFLRQIWERTNLIELGTKLQLGDALKDIAATCCSTELAQYLINGGVPVDYRRKDTFCTPLHHAAKKDSTIAANFIRFLLEQGADPDAYSVSIPKYGSKVRRVRDEKGAREISKWLGMTWDQLLEATNAARGRVEDGSSGL